MVAKEKIKEVEKVFGKVYSWYVTNQGYKSERGRS
jgi:hypothetical protein